LRTLVFPCPRRGHGDRYRIQDGTRLALTRWGLPGRPRVDNGCPWGNSGDSPPEMALWLLGRGVDMVWIPLACPWRDGVVERSEDIGQGGFEPPTCRDPGERQRRCDARDRRRRERYPYRDGRSRWEVDPALRHSGRRCSRRREPSRRDVAKVHRVVARQEVKRQVDCTGCASVYHRNRCVGKPYVGAAVYGSPDPTGPAWVIADEAGRQLRTHAANELPAGCIRHLRVAGRKGKRQGQGERGSKATSSGRKMTNSVSGFPRQTRCPVTRQAGPTRCGARTQDRNTGAAGGGRRAIHIVHPTGEGGGRSGETNRDMKRIPRRTCRPQ
jgi:hypothetical protein